MKFWPVSKIFLRSFPIFAHFIFNLIPNFHFDSDDLQYYYKIFIIQLCIYIPGDDLLCGNALLELPARVAVALSSCFEQIRDNDLELSFEALPATTAVLPNIQEVQLLFDFAQKLKNLRVNSIYILKEL